jgi:hypothetical protein
MAAQRPAETVRKIAELALSDAVEITLLIALIEGQNTGGVNKKLGEAGADRAGAVVRNALIARLVLLIARAYAKPKQGDLHLAEAAGLLKHNSIRQVFGGDGAEKLAAFDAQFAKCRGDHRLPLIKDFRDKYTAHLGEPEVIKEATYRDLFAFGAETARAMELLSLAAGTIVRRIIDADPELVSSPEAFWAPWKDGSGDASALPALEKTQHWSI